jgi:hypothetical protein
MIKFRFVTENDRSQLENWISADSEHSGQPVSFWMPSDEKIQNYVIQDEQGDLFYVRAENLLRLHIQFAPNQKERTARAVDEYTQTLAQGAKKLGYKQLIFESTFKPLIRFLQKRGFRSSQNEQVMDL